MTEETRDDVVTITPSSSTLATTEETPVKVTLAELAAVNNVPTAESRRLDEERRQRRAWLARLPKTPAGLPKGYQWIPHDTGKLGYAAARRRAQMEKLAAKRAKVQDVDGEVRHEGQ